MYLSVYGFLFTPADTSAAPMQNDINLNHIENDLVIDADTNLDLLGANNHYQTNDLDELCLWLYGLYEMKNVKLD